MSSIEFTALVRWDRRMAARLTETGLHPIDVALTFTGLAAAIFECLERVGAML